MWWVLLAVLSTSPTVSVAPQSPCAPRATLERELQRLGYSVVDEGTVEVWLEPQGANTISLQLRKAHRSVLRRELRGSCEDAALAAAVIIERYLRELQVRAGAPTPSGPNAGDAARANARPETATDSRDPNAATSEPTARNDGSSNNSNGRGTSEATTSKADPTGTNSENARGQRETSATPNGQSKNGADPTSASGREAEANSTRGASAANRNADSNATRGAVTSKRNAEANATRGTKRNGDANSARGTSDAGSNGRNDANSARGTIDNAGNGRNDANSTRDAPAGTPRSDATFARGTSDNAGNGRNGASPTRDGPAGTPRSDATSARGSNEAAGNGRNDATSSSDAPAGTARTDATSARGMNDAAGGRNDPSSERGANDASGRNDANSTREAPAGTNRNDARDPNGTGSGAGADSSTNEPNVVTIREAPTDTSPATHRDFALDSWELRGGGGAWVPTPAQVSPAVSLSAAFHFAHRWRFGLDARFGFGGTTAVVDGTVTRGNLLTRDGVVHAHGGACTDFGSNERLVSCASLGLGPRFLIGTASGSLIFQTTTAVSTGLSAALLLDATLRLGWFRVGLGAMVATNPLRASVAIEGLTTVTTAWVEAMVGVTIGLGSNAR